MNFRPIRLSVAGLPLLLLCGATVPVSIALLLSPTGVDEGDCQHSPCKTLQYAADQVPAGYVGVVRLAPGTYKGGVNFIYWRVLGIGGDCSDLGAVVIENDQANSTTFIAQDHATILVNCLTVRATAPGVNIFGSRQFAILDYGNVHLTAAPGGSIATAASPSDIATMSCLGPVFLDAPMQVYFLAGAKSLGNLGCPHIVNTKQIGYMLSIGKQAYIDASQTKWSGPGVDEGIDGFAYAVDAEGILHIAGDKPPGRPGPVDRIGRVD
jgi:hypothetical protein